MPAHTPSPHRFLAPNPASRELAKQKPQSSLRYGSTTQSLRNSFSPRALQPAPAETPRGAPAKRFVVAPARDALSGGGKKESRSDEAWESPQAHPAPRTKPSKKLKRVESIEAGSQESPSASLRFRQHEDDATELEEEKNGREDNQMEEEEQEEDEEDELLFGSVSRGKRRRASPRPPSSPSQTSPLTSHHPQTPFATRSTSSHRFLVPGPKLSAPFPSSSAASVTPASASTRPQFLLPRLPTSPQKLATPLPETFSPSRKGQKYIPGGLASTLQSWIVETAGTGYQAQQGNAVVWGRDREDGVKMKFRILHVFSGAGTAHGDPHQTPREVECFPGGVVFVRGVNDPALYNASRVSVDVPGDGSVRILLAGQGGARGSGGVRIREGSIVGIRGPLWDVEVDEEGGKWIVGVDWVVL